MLLFQTISHATFSKCYILHSTFTYILRHSPIHSQSTPFSHMLPCYFLKVLHSHTFSNASFSEWFILTHSPMLIFQSAPFSKNLSCFFLKVLHSQTSSHATFSKCSILTHSPMLISQSAPFSEISHATFSKCHILTHFPMLLIQSAICYFLHSKFRDILKHSPMLLSLRGGFI